MERSFGIIPLRKTADGWETLLVQHSAGHWAFPKGHAEPGETPHETATRELLEETNLHITHLLAIEPLQEGYSFKREGVSIEKVVTYFPAEVEGKVALQAEEIADYAWLSLEQAKKRATFPEMRALIDRLSLCIS